MRDAYLVHPAAMLAQINYCGVLKIRSQNAAEILRSAQNDRLVTCIVMLSLPAAWRSISLVSGDNP